MFRLSEKTTYLGTFLFDILFLNILWIIGSIPLFTIGQSTIALYHVFGKIIRKEQYSVLNDYIRSYRINFLQGTFLSILLIVIFCTFIACIRLLSTDIYSIILSIIIFCAAIQMLTCYLYAVAFLSRYNIKTTNLIILTIYIFYANILKSIVSVSLLFLLAYFTYYIPPLFIICSFSSFSYIHYSLIRNIIDTDWNECFTPSNRMQ